MKALFIITIIATMITKGCDKEIPEKQCLPITDGIYTGTFTLTTPTGVSTGDATIQIEGNRFSASGNANRIPAGGSGNFSLSDDRQTITFQDENFWTADFDWSLILSGNFVYSFDGEKLEFARQTHDGRTFQKYQLIKNNLQ